MRIATKDFVFFDGTRLPKGSIVSVASDSIQNDEEYYSNPEVFNPWRFSDLNENTSKTINASTTSTEFLIFGHGRRAWYVTSTPVFFRIKVSDVFSLALVVSSLRQS